MFLPLARVKFVTEKVTPGATLKIRVLIPPSMVTLNPAAFRVVFVLI